MTTKSQLFDTQFLDILIYIGTYIDKDILIMCAELLKEPKEVDIKEVDIKEEPKSKEVDIKEIHGDLFTTSDETSSLAHCVAKDLGMGKGIAVYFKKKYGGVSELKAQDPQIGSMAVLKKDGKYIYYLVTKARSTGLPTLTDLKRSLIAMKNHAVQHSVKMISMPRIGSGLDRLDWNKVKDTIIEVFNDTGIKIRIFWI